MDDKQFDALVRRLEPVAAASPRAYLARVVALALLGYAYIGAVLAVALGGVALSIVAIAEVNGAAALLGKLAIAIIAFAWIVVRSLWVRFTPPEGRLLRPDEAPVLFAEAEELRRTLAAPRAHRVVLDDSYNASVYQMPRLGAFGWPRNYLIVGLTLLETLPADAVRAVLAHEFAHLSSAHGKAGAWIYRVRSTWFGLMQRLDQSRHRGAAIFRRFFDWYAPYFAAYSFVLMRRHELEADRLAAGVVGSERMAQTLVDLEVRNRFLSGQFWPRIWSAAADSDTPPDDVYTRLARVSAEPVSPDALGAWLVAAMKRRTDTNDTHPALADRLGALLARNHAAKGTSETRLGATAAFAAPAADHYLGASHAPLARERGQQWQHAAAEGWRQRHQAVRAAREGLAAIESRVAAGTPGVEDRWTQAALIEQLHGADAAFPLYQALLADTPDHLSASYAVGRILLSRGDESGRALVEAVMGRDDDAVLPGCQLVYGYLASEGRLEEADEYRRRAVRESAVLQRAQYERTHIETKDTYEPPALSPEVMDEIARQARSIPGISRVYVARKQLTHLADRPVHVLVVIPHARFWRPNTPKKLLEQARALARQFQLPEGVVPFGVGSKASPLVKPIAKVKGTLLYDRRRHRAASATAVSTSADQQVS